MERFVLQSGVILSEVGVVGVGVDIIVEGGWVDGWMGLS